jgi:xylulokinase
MSLLLGIDLGTSYFKVGLFDAAGALKGLGRVAVETDRPAPRRFEVPVPRFWMLLRRGLAEALDQAGANAREIAAVSYSSQTNSFVLLDRADSPLTPIVLWTDERAEPTAPDMVAFSRREEFARTVGFSGWSGGFAAAKWRWFQENEAEIWARTDRALTLADYLTFALTGECVGDASTAAFLGLYDLAQRRWWLAALAACRVEAAQLASPLAPGTVAGRTVPRAMELLGLPAGVPFAVGGLDHHVAALGSGLGVKADVSI